MRSMVTTVLAIILRLSCGAQQVPNASNNLSTPGDQEAAVPAANMLVGSAKAEAASFSLWPRPYIYGGLALSRDAGYSPAAGTVGGGMDVESEHFVGVAEGSLQNAHKVDSSTGTETDLKSRLFLRISPGWFLGGGAQWSRLNTVAYAKQAWRPVFGGGKDVLREDFSMRAQVVYVLPGDDHLNAVQGPEISLWMPSPNTRRHFFYRQTFSIYEFHQTAVPGNIGTRDRNAAIFAQFTGMYRF